ncbi:hypothetical protein BaRGS_00023393 [Batillaria attramentaria]|uniref:Uncharacterized protein n=1 Tax=Batillaria attramentaria TaxID=370345 RepID=A0ABD0KDV4_9CAEN
MKRIPRVTAGVATDYPRSRAHNNFKLVTSLVVVINKRRTPCGPFHFHFALRSTAPSVGHESATGAKRVVLMVIIKCATGDDRSLGAVLIKRHLSIRLRET